MDTATIAQRDLIAELAAVLRLRRIDPWAEDLTNIGASDLIDQLQLRRLSQKVNRPITVDLRDREAVRRELDRVSALAGERRGRKARIAGDANNGVRITHVQPQARPALSAGQERQRHAELDRGPIEPYGTGRFSESTGYGAHASYSVQRAESLGEHRDSPAITDAQERYVIKLQDQASDSSVVAQTVEQASEEIERLTEDNAPAPTQRQATYLADLQKRAGVDLEPAATRDAASAAIRHLLEQMDGQVVGRNGPSRLQPAEAEPVTASNGGNGIGARR